MGLFDIFRKNTDGGAPKSKEQKDLMRLQRLVGSKLSQNLDRQDAIHQLARMGTAGAASALLRRFDWNLDPSITDQEEKEAAARGIAAAGEAALEPIRAYCEGAESLTWPLKILKEIVPEDRLANELLGILDRFDTEYMRNAEPKIQLLAMLQDYPCEDVRVAVEPFVTDANEPARFTAVGTIFAVSDPASVPILVAALEEEESLRVKNRIAQGMSERGWTIPEELIDTCRKALPPGFQVVGGKVQAS